MKDQNCQEVELLMRLLHVDGGSGDEGRIARCIREECIACGVLEKWIHEDQAHRKFTGFSQGNLIVKIPGKRGLKRILFSSHMDTVPLCRNSKPVREGNRITSSVATAVGGDNRTGVAVLLNLAKQLTHSKTAPPVTLLFTFGEEVGLCGASEVSLSQLGRPVMGFNFDGGDPSKIVTGAIGADRFHIVIEGYSAHAGLHPEQGVSAGILAAMALEQLNRDGWHGAIVKGSRSGTANVGSMNGGEATNQVMDRLEIRAEARSHHLPFLNQITKAWKTAFEHAAQELVSSEGRVGTVSFNARREYKPFKISVRAPVVTRATEAVKACGLKPHHGVTNGGLDANPLNEKGLSTVTLGAGQHGPHTVDEYVDVKEFQSGCQLALALCGIEHK